MRRGLAASIALLLLVNLVQAPLALAEPASPQPLGSVPGFDSARHQRLPLRPRGGTEWESHAPELQSAGASGLFLAQFSGPVGSESQQFLRDAGAEVGPYMGAEAYLIRATAAVVTKLSADPHIAAVIRYTSAWKVSPAVKVGERRNLRVTTFTAPDQSTSTTLQAAGARAEGTTAFHLDDANDETVKRLAQSEDVLLIEPVVEPKLVNDYATGIMGITTESGPRPKGLNGQNQIIGIADSGLDTGSPTTLHPDLKGHLAVTPIPYARSSWSDPFGHGTHVAGSVLGDGTASGGQIKGAAPAAKMVFQSIVRSDGYFSFPSVTQLLNDAYNSGARIHTDSWGAAVSGEYTYESYEVDAVTSAKRDYTVLFAAGNEGMDQYSGTPIYNSIITPATAKNAIAVGASENIRPDIYDTWADNKDQLAPFSSKGFTADGRIKPDVVAPGTFILSTRSALAGDLEFWATYNSRYAYMGGTSMATPLTAGAAALVRQHYVERRAVAKPSSALIKATLINGAQDLGYGWGSREQGWGRVDLTNSLNPQGRSVWFQDEKTALQAGQYQLYEFQASAGEILKFTLTWTDLPASSSAIYNLVNNLNLSVQAPDGQTYRGNCFVGNTAATSCAADMVNNVENVYFAAPQTGTYRVQVTASSIPTGAQPYALVVSGKDLQYAADPVGPAITVGGLTEGGVIKSTVPVSVQATDVSGVTAVEFYLDDQYQAFDGVSPYTWSLNTVPLTPGAHTVTITAYDRYGTASSVTRTIIVDNQAPGVEYTNRGASAYLPAGSHEMTVNAWDDNGIAKVEFYQGTALKTTLTAAPYTWNWSTAGLTSGTYPIVAKAYDPAGNVATATLSVVLDTALPTASLTTPTAGSFLRGTVTLTATATDSGGIASAEFQLDNTTLQCLTTGPYTWGWDTKLTTDGPHTLSVIATDRAGNQKSSTLVPVTVDNTNPAVSLPLTDGALVRNGQVLTADATDNTAIAKVEFLVGSTVTVTDNAAPYTWTLASLTNYSTYALSARITDKAGNSFTSTPIRVTADSVAPTGVTLTGLTANSTIQGVQSLTVTGTDTIGVTRVELWVDGKPASTQAPAPITFPWDTTTVTDGPHSLQAKVYDGAGNMATSTALTITVDNQDPILGAITPGDGSQIRGTATITAIATDAVGMQRVEFWFGGTLKATDTAAPFSLSLPTTGTSGLADGDYTLMVKAFDKAGHEAARSITVRVDNTLPTVSFLDRTSPAYLPGGSHVMTVDAADENGIAKVEFYQGTALKATLTAAPYTWTWSTAGLASGTYPIVAKAYDPAGNVTVTTLSVVLDTALPTVSLTKPTAGSFLRGTVPLTATATDSGGIASVEFRLDDSSLQTLTASPYTWNWDTTLTTDGPHTLSVIATDRAGNKKTSTLVSVTVDNANPSVSLPLTGGALVRNGQVLTAEASDNIGIAKVEFLVGSKVTVTDTTAPFTWSLSGLTNYSTYTLSARITDKAGNSFTSTPINVTADSVAPTGVTLTGLTANSTIQGVQSLTVTGTDTTGVTRVELWLDGNLASTQAAAPATLPWDTSSVTDGPHTVQAKVYDGASNMASTTILTVIVDNKDPVLGAITPGDGTSIRGTATITAVATDAVGMQRVEFWLGGTLKATDTAAPYSFSLPTTGTSGLADGDYTLLVKAFDKAGHEVERSITLRVDNTLPTISLTTPTAGMLFGPEVVKVTANPFDGNAVSRVEFFVGSTKVYTATGPDWTWDWNTAPLASGNYQLKATAVDAAGNATTSAIVSVVVDTTKPTLSISGPAAGAILKGDLIVTATTSDAKGINRVEFWVDDTLRQTSTTAPYTWTWATNEVADSTHTVTVMAYDTVGNVTLITRAVKTDNTAPTVSFATLSEGSIVATGSRINLDTFDAVGVAKADYYLNGVWKATVTGAPYAWILPTLAKGAYELKVIVTDKVGLASTPAIVHILVDAAAPTLTVTGIASSTIVKGTVTMTVNATDDIGLDRLELWVGTTHLHSTHFGGGISVSGAPLTWDTTLNLNGSTTVKIRIYDQVGRMKELTYTVTVRN